MFLEVHLQLVTSTASVRVGICQYVLDHPFASLQVDLHKGKEGVD